MCYRTSLLIIIFRLFNFHQASGLKKNHENKLLFICLLAILLSFFAREFCSKNIFFLLIFENSLYYIFWMYIHSLYMLQLFKVYNLSCHFVISSKYRNFIFHVVMYAFFYFNVCCSWYCDLPNVTKIVISFRVNVSNTFPEYILFSVWYRYPNLIVPHVDNNLFYCCCNKYQRLLRMPCLIPFPVITSSDFFSPPPFFFVENMYSN